MSVLAIAKIVLDGDTVQLTKALAGAEAAMQQAGEKMQAMGKKLTLYLTTPILGLGAASFKMASDFETSLNLIQGMVGIQRKEIDGWREDIRKLAIQYGSSADKAADALFFITSAGQRGSEAMDTLKISLKASAAGLGEVKVVADAVTSAMAAYSDSNLTANRATEILIGAVRAGKLEADQLAPVIGRLTPTAAAMGIAFEQVAGLLAVFSRTGTDASEAATQLSGIMSTLLKPTKQAKEALDSVGISMEDLRQMAKGPNGLLEVMRLLEAKMGDNEEAFSAIVPNVRAFRGMMNALAQDTAVVDDIMSQTTNSVGVLDEAFAATVQGPGFAMKQMIAAIKDAFISVGDAIFPVLIPAIKMATEWLQVLSNWFRNLSDTTKTWLVVVAGLVAAIGPLVLGLGLMAKAMVALQIANMISAFAGWIVMVAKMITMIDSFTHALIFLKVAIGPAGWVILGIGAVVGLLALWYNKQAELNRLQRESAEAMDNYRAALVGVKQAQLAVAQSSIQAAITTLTTRLQEQNAALAKWENQLVSSQRVAMEAEGIMVRMSEGEATLRAQRERTTEALRQLTAMQGALNDAMALAQRTGADLAIAQYQALIDAAKTPVEKFAAVQTMLNSLLKDGKITQVEYGKALEEARKQMQATATTSVGAAAANDAVKEAVVKLVEAERAIPVMQAALGAGYDANAARITAYRTAVEDLAKANVSLTTVIPGLGITLGALIAKLQTATTTAAAQAVSQKTMNEQLQLAQSTVNSLLTPMDKFLDLEQALDVALISGAVTWDQYNAAMAAAKDSLSGLDEATTRYKQLVEASKTPLDKFNETMALLDRLLKANRITTNEFGRAVAQARTELENAGKTTNQVGDAMAAVAEGATRAFLSFASGSKNAIRGFVQDALQQLGRLAGSEIFKSLGKFGGPLGGLLGGLVGGLFGGLFAGGGYLEAGKIGIVGEQGPELIQAGRRGVTIAPSAAMRGDSGTGNIGAWASAIVDALGPPPPVMSPEVAAVDGYYRRLFGAMVTDGKRRGVL